MILTTLSCAHSKAGRDSQGQLTTCPNSPNCVSSLQNEQPTHQISPLQVTDAQPMDEVIKIIKEMGGSIVSSDENYCHSTFTSKWLRFVDDFEVLYSKEYQRLDIKSSSRTGYSDMGVNKARYKTFHKLWEKLSH